MTRLVRYLDIPSTLSSLAGKRLSKSTVAWLDMLHSFQITPYQATQRLHVLLEQRLPLQTSNVTQEPNVVTAPPAGLPSDISDREYHSPNFHFLARHHPFLVRYAAQAERYLFDDASTALIKIRQFAELLAHQACASIGVGTASQDRTDEPASELLDRIREQASSEVKACET